MNFQYHRNTLIKTDSDHPMVVEALGLLDNFEQIQEKFSQFQISVEDYISGITPYDRFMFMNAKLKPQKTNPINTMQNKKYSTYREQIWLPVWIRICSLLQKLQNWQDVKLVVIQNKKLVERVYKGGYLAYKDVDGGIAVEIKINNKTVLIPVIAVEDKGGHACKTCHSGVDAQGERIHKSFPNAIHIFITDNHVTVGRDAQEFAHTNITISERGYEGVQADYDELRADRFAFVEKFLVETLSKMSPQDFTDYIEVVEDNRNYWSARAPTDTKPDGITVNYHPKIKIAIP